MFFMKSVYCRAFQAAFRLALPVLPYREPKILNSCANLGEVMKQENVTSVLIVTDKGIVDNGLLSSLEKVLKENKVVYQVYDRTKPNPTVANVEEALSLYHENHSNCLIAVGGGSSMDCAKAVGVRVAYPKKTVNQMGGKLKV